MSVQDDCKVFIGSKRTNLLSVGEERYLGFDECQ